MSKYTTKILVIVLCSIAVIYRISLYSANPQTTTEQNEIIGTKTNVAKLISSALEIKFSEKIKTLEMEGDLPSVQNVAYANYLNASIKDILDTTIISYTSSYTKKLICLTTSSYVHPLVELFDVCPLLEFG